MRPRRRPHLHRPSVLNSLHVRIVLWGMCIMLTASLFAFAASNLILYRSIEEEVRSGQEHIARSMLTLAQRTTLTADEIGNMAATTAYAVHPIDDFRAYKLTIDQAERLSSQGYLYLSGGYNGVTLVRIGEKAFVIQANTPGRNLFVTNLLRIALTLLFALVLAMAILSLSGRRMLRPIRALRLATQEVARGNFDVLLPVRGKDEMSRLIVNFNQMTRDLSRMEMLRNDFINNVSHEFKTPLANIQGYANLLSQSDLGPEQQPYAQIIAQEAARLSKLTTNILRLSKLENQDSVPDQKHFSLDEQLRQCLVALQEDWQAKDLQFDILLDSTEYFGNEELLQQVWLNLIGNAIKFSPREGLILVRCYRREQGVQVVITDQGPGMDKETQDRIFEKFYQGDRAHSSEGNGLGLPLVKRILDLCGGSIAVQSKPREGASFIVDLPITG